MESDHLLVLVHGLWGNTSHFDYVTRAIDNYYVYNDLAENNAYEPSPVRDLISLSDSNFKKNLAPNSKYRKPKVLVTKSNQGYLTYDGIDMCGAKVAHEIEHALDQYETLGTPINKISIVGYSLGGLMARYAIGILYQKGIFKKIMPVNFTTFCTPHVGVRAPGADLATTLFNALVPRTMSATGRQLFMVDKFSNSDMPLICFLADRSSIFYHALTLFSHRSLYANIANDRRTSWFTAAISMTDPFLDLHAVTLHGLPNYGPVILQPDDPVSVNRPQQNHRGDDATVVVNDDDDNNSTYRPLVDLSTGGALTGVKSRARQLTVLSSFFIMLYNFLVVSPIWVFAFLISAAIQTFHSSRRLREFHSAKKGRYGMDEFRLLRLDEQFEEVVDTVLGDLVPYSISHSTIDVSTDSTFKGEKPGTDGVSIFLDLTADQRKMIWSLNQLSWQKFPVHITKTKAAHAAVIVRHMDWKGMEEGEVVIRHWLTEVLKV
ncbi:putative serine esterase-domain-containing protein [Lipomyces japonicus]|uniref:putative serine esterase-domain-containing protein n=1 Tax=Lipomyces japonicus TaxID=56871 RepID=UPI0034CD3546